MNAFQISWYSVEQRGFLGGEGGSCYLVTKLQIDKVAPAPSLHQLKLRFELSKSSTQTQNQLSNVSHKHNASRKTEVHQLRQCKYINAFVHKSKVETS